MFEKLANSIARRPQPETDMIRFGPWSDGLVTEYQPEQMKLSQLYESLNMILVGPGVQRTRDGSSLVCSGCDGAVTTIKDIKVGGTWYTILSDTDNNLYYNDSGTATAIATLEGEAQFCGFMGLLIIFDGSFIKAWDGTDIFILYDNGTGAVSPFQVNNRAATSTTDKPLGNGTITSVELAFTSQTWDSGYTIPPTHIYAQMYKVEATPGTLSGTITAKLQTAGGVDMASSPITVDAGTLTTDTAGEEYEAIILSSEVTTEMAPNTSYKVVLSYSGGDASNYINVKAVDASTPMFSLKPGMPPKAAFGLVHEDRLHCIEGASGTNPSYRWYCAAGNHLDWSTADGGGFTPVIDSSATNYPIGGIASWADGLWFFGTPQQPFLGKQTGGSPSEWAINRTMQKVSGHYKSIVVTPDNIVFLHPSGVDMITSVQESSDIAAESQADKIRKTIQQYFSSAAVAGYDPEWGLYALKMTGTDSVYIINTRAKSVKYRGQKGTAFSPATRWEYAFSGNPTAFGQGNGFMLVGTDDGKAYKMDKDEVEDAGSDVTYKFITASKPTVFGEAQAYQIAYKIFGKTGGSCNIKFYKNYSRSSFFTLPFTLPVDSTLLTSEMTMLTSEADFYMNPEQYFDREILNFNYRNLMIGFEDIELRGKPLYFGEINLLSKSIGGF
jgi:hypothetical protein